MMHPGADEVYGVTITNSCIDRIRAYVNDSEVQREIAAVTEYIDQGIADFEVYLARHAEFSEFLGGEQ